ncbi:MAG: hypothetical protein PHD72_01985 [Patescibacteria group bacterium]|nr:hypothetical protein [Patescibacteria group bacterium]
MVENPSNKGKLAIILALIIIVAGGSYFGYGLWQKKRQGHLKNIGLTDPLAQDIAKFAAEDAQKQAEANKSPADKFQDAEAVEISKESEKTMAEEMTAIIKSLFDDAKITAFTDNYMGLSEGSGIMQLMTPKKLSLNDSGNLSRALAEKGYNVINTTEENNSAAIIADKNNKTYTVGFNNDEQEIVIIITAPPSGA